MILVCSFVVIDGDLYLLLCVSVIGVVLFCVFFFKQKTAYEMRISDWSSDVCSSDLENEDEVAMINHLGCRKIQGYYFGRPMPANEAMALFPDSQQKIGRASCRERVWSVRVDLGGRRIIKKKKNRNKTFDLDTRAVHTLDQIT